MDEIAESVYIFFILIDVVNVGIGIGVMVGMMIIFLYPLKLHGVHLFLPILFVEGLYLFVFIVYPILVFYLNVDGVVIVDRVCLLFIVY